MLAVHLYPAWSQHALGFSLQGARTAAGLGAPHQQAACQEGRYAAAAAHMGAVGWGAGPRCADATARCAAGL